VQAGLARAARFHLIRFAVTRSLAAAVHDICRTSPTVDGFGLAGLQWLKSFVGRPERIDGHQGPDSCLQVGVDGEWARALTCDERGCGKPAAYR
jgi:hypothetical protein